MRQVEDIEAWLDALATSHEVKSTATLLRPGKEDLELPGLIGGNVTLDQTADTRGSVSLQFIDDGTMDLVPEDPSSMLAPYGQELQVRRGVVLHGGGYEQLISLGIFRTQDARSTENGDGSLTVDVVGFDRSVKIKEAKFLHPPSISNTWTIPGGTDYLSVMKSVISDADPGAVFHFPAFSATVPLLTIQEQDDRWAFVTDLATAIGMDLYLDGDGVYTLKAIPTLGVKPVAELVEGQDGLLTSAVSDWTREGSHNGFVFTGENTDTSGDPPRGEALDLNVASPTYFYGAFGQVPDWKQSSIITTNDQALQAARGQLAKSLGTSRSIDFGSIVNPALEPTDVILVKRERLHVNENHIIDNLVIPLEAETEMTGRTRAALVPS